MLAVEFSSQPTIATRNAAATDVLVVNFTIPLPVAPQLTRSVLYWTGMPGKYKRPGADPEDKVHGIKLPSSALARNQSAFESSTFPVF
jgi:hypothetical protein